VKVQAVDKFVDELKKIQGEAEAALHKRTLQIKHVLMHQITKLEIKCGLASKT